MPATEHWARLRNSGSALGIRTLLLVYRIAGRGAFHVLLRVVLVYYYLRRGDARAASREYLRRLAAFAPAAPPARLTPWRHLVSFGEALLDRLLAWSGALARGDIEVVGMPTLREAVDGGRGGVILTAHVGSFDVAQALGQKIPGLRLTILVHITDQDQFNRVKASVNAASQLEFMQVTEITPATGMLFAERIDRGEFVLIAGDRIPLGARSSVLSVPFLGAPALFPAGPYWLATVLRCPVYAFWCLRHRRHYRAYFHALGDGACPRRQRQANMLRLAGSYARLLQQVCLDYPLQWYNFYRFWTPPRDTDYAVLKG